MEGREGDERSEAQHFVCRDIGKIMLLYHNCQGSNETIFQGVVVGSTKYVWEFALRAKVGDTYKRVAAVMLRKLLRTRGAV